MQQIFAVWNALDTRKQIIVTVATLAMFAAVLTIARIAAQPSMALLYAGLEPGSAGELIQALEARGVTTDVRSGAIYVDASRRDELRMTLASEGLPRDSAQGYELLDNLSGFGTTSQMFDAAYWRAKEGELARTIVSSPLIKSARVHIAIPNSQTFRNRSAPSGSVTVTTAQEALSGPHAKALKFLVASAVPGLSPDDVSIIDSRGGMVMTRDDDAAFEGGTNARAEALKQNVERLLEARVGYGNAIVELSIDTALESETILERVFDPENRVVIATETEESTAASSGNGQGGVTVASNLPNGEAEGGDSSSNNTETRERVNYEVSETTREINRGPGTVRRISVAVLVDGIRTRDDNGQEVWAPRSDEELDALRDLVTSAVGLNETRGDTITIKSMAFEPIVSEGTEASAGLWGNLGIDAMSLIRLGILSIVALVLGLFVLRPILAGKGNTAGATAVLAGPTSLASPQVTAPNTLTALTGEIDDTNLPAVPESAIVADFDFGNTLADDLPQRRGQNDPVDRLRTLIEERQTETVEILRGWMEDEETA
ncbi:flagellar basal-body MS-ring/collar protein FliF [Maritimibacter sp. HL-12]|uniref:flagellar basal-body MS-ring/collar protein FliF n=1 Tax=Maritimibacter sp. HL-12 TaxID=1162418 RepID=UPI000A0F3213|nr:flagellar basal-body MS-ring/collar protein FliF [Maritimibacter sp. HL-12]SMH43060.1 flagellar M-ring protein FliF [Maritimibacter sp. HL-12]